VWLKNGRGLYQGLIRGHLDNHRVTQRSQSTHALYYRLVIIHVRKINHKIKLYCNIENKTSLVKKINVTFDNLTNVNISHIENLKENT
jgi:hypothetical protein